MKSIVIADKEYAFKRPSPPILAVAESIVNESELFNTVINIATVYRDEKERYAKLAVDWKSFCDVVLVEGFKEELNLDNLIYPDEVWELSESFFSSASERTSKRLSELAERSRANTTSR